MISVEPTVDEEFLKSVFLNPEIYAQMNDDSCPLNPDSLKDRVLLSVPGFYLRAQVDGKDVGAFLLTPEDGALCAHTALLPGCRGRSAINVTKAAIRWVFANTKTPVLTSFAWSDSPAVAWFCRAVGLREQSTAPWPNTRKGLPVTITYYSLRRDQLAA